MYRPRIAIVEAMGFDTDTYRDAKAITHPRMEKIGPVIDINDAELRDGLLHARLLDLITSG